jgi:cell division protein FtsI (penicillin-binding protein 3)
MITPRITRSIVADPQTEYSLPKQAQSRIISENTYSKIHRVLLDVVQKGTGVKAQVPGIEIGGKTGTAHIAKNGVYANSYNSSFFGFANDTKSRYTIGVLVIEPKAKHFAADTAVPVFKNIILKLQDDGLLSKPEVIQAQ